MPVARLKILARVVHVCQRTTPLINSVGFLENPEAFNKEMSQMGELLNEQLTPTVDSIMSGKFDQDK